jgi:hypothetical protein
VVRNIYIRKISKNFGLDKNISLYTYGSRSEESVDKIVKCYEVVMRRVAHSDDKFAEDKSK